MSFYEVVDNCACCNHRFNQVALFNLDFNQERFGSALSFCQRFSKFFTSSNGYAVATARFCKANEIKLSQNSVRVSFVVEELLSLSYHTQAAIVDYDADNRQVFTACSKHFHTSHFETAIATDVYDLRIRFSKSCTHSTG